MHLFVNSPGTMIKQKDGCFRLSNEDRHLDVSPEKLESIITTNKALISTQAVILALEHNIDVVFLDEYGDPMGRIWFTKMGSTALIRRRQIEAEMGALGIRLVLDLVMEKTQNQTRFLKKLAYARPGKDDLIDPEKDKVYLFPFCQDDFKQIKVLGQGFDKKLVNDEILSQFF